VFFLTPPTLKIDWQLAPLTATPYKMTTNYVEFFDLTQMTLQELIDYKNIIEFLFERVRNQVFSQQPRPDTVPQAWTNCVQAINSIQAEMLLH
jgi:hypothetical protein